MGKSCPILLMANFACVDVQLNSLKGHQIGSRVDVNVR